MSYLKVKGIVIKEINTGEADKVAVILSGNHGKFSAYAKYAKRPKSKLAAGTQFLCYSEFVLFKGRDMYSINSSDIIEPFYEVRNDIVKLTCSAHIVELINDIVQENQPSSKIQQLFLNTLYMFAKTEKPPELVTRIFELRFLSLLGFAPGVKGCTICGREVAGGMSFSFRNCGFLCSNCIIEDEYAMEIMPGTAKAINYIAYSRIEDLFNFNVSPEVLTELEKISRRYLRERLEKDYNKMDFLKTLKS